ncbi:7-carboxy-7-deazaguanine synthase [Saccharospirillum mangrovi]|uniref:7-carboxy-7-deazaguanine synthase n=1 Tax=Saccharospirillum mangrovi TaxID=2161747 RepID=UPI001E43DBD4|nr:7-carboxy-7-deazaguanine synthase [Saccharospirillum mangrovi]
MTFSVKEMFYTLQGEGAQAGRPAVFCRFTGCNLWSGREQDRSTAVCTFCDTDFLGTNGPGGGRFADAKALCDAISALWPNPNAGRPYVVFTGGEPSLQLTEDLIDQLHQAGFECAIETNGTRPLPANLDWVCVSPKGRSEVIVKRCDELKLVYPQAEAMPERFDQIDAQYRFLSPLNPWDAAQIAPATQSSTRAAIDYCLAHPQWRLTVQMHKVVNIA